MRVVRTCLAVVAGSSVALSACATHRLGEFEYADHTLSVVSEIPRQPEVLSGPYFFGRRSGDPLRDIARLGTRVYREVEARAIRERLDSAVVLVDVGYVLEERTLDRAARYLGADPVTGEEGDYVLELVVVDYGIDAESWEATAYFYIEADAALLEAASGTEVWRAEIGARDPIGPEIYGPAHGVRNVVTAATLGDLDVEEIADALEALADYSARVVTDRLRDDLRDVRRRVP